MNNFLSRVQTQWQAARVSEVNHELGKVKETLVQESSQYLHNLRSDAVQVGSLIRSESLRFSTLFGSTATTADTQPQHAHASEAQSLALNRLPKSASLPVIQAHTQPSKHRGTKYQYKSSEAPPVLTEEVDEGPTQSLDQSVIDRFIRVVEVTESSTRVSAPPTTVGHPIRPNTREEIRKKLAASFGSTHHDSDPELRPNGFRKGFLPADNHDLQICFINEVVSSGEDDDHDDHDDEDPRTDSTCGVDQKEDSSEDSDTEEAVYPRSRIDWESFRNPDLESPQALQSPPASSHRDEKRRRKFKKKLSKLQKEVQVNLSDCQAIAKKLVDKERLKRGQNNPLRQLLGVSNDRFTLSQLGTYNFASLQVIVNHLHNQIESHNQELVQLLIQKDELQIEQDSQLLDIEDLTHNLPLSQTL
ncbi:schwannomin-interacting protein 1-like [Tigriopus californicus]|uniref:schwannomin-interacting protein 1-like n=1 Tax=Tigriopus californicus TaxID=6832 RepID=UPI0027D9DED0|nr:schwannomin-interacting protein 1-like [Tigriopus californicus]